MADDADALKNTLKQLKNNRAEAAAADLEIEQAEITFIAAKGKIKALQLENAEILATALRKAKRWDPSHPLGNAEMENYEAYRKYLEQKEVNFNVPIAVYDLEKKIFTHESTVPLSEYLESATITSTLIHIKENPGNEELKKVFNSLIYGRDTTPPNAVVGGKPEYAEYIDKSNAKITHAVAVFNGEVHLRNEKIAALEKAQTPAPATTSPTPATQVPVEQVKSSPATPKPRTGQAIPQSTPRDDDGPRERKRRAPARTPGSSLLFPPTTLDTKALLAELEPRQPGTQPLTELERLVASLGSVGIPGVMLADPATQPKPLAPNFAGSAALSGVMLSNPNDKPTLLPEERGALAMARGNTPGGK